MAKKNDIPETPDLFGFDAPVSHPETEPGQADASGSGMHEPEAAGAESKEPKASFAPEAVAGEQTVQPEDAVPAGEGPDGAGVSEETALEQNTPATPQRDENGLPVVLSDGVPPEENGELTLARYAAKAYLEYALSVVKDRALPDVFDGMKPVQRRILYSMDRMRLLPTAKAVKCARVVGDVLGKYHPHGDQAAYEAMVRMAQDFSLRYPLVDGQGNFGSRDGDGPAAMRYTEARLTKISALLLEELDSGDVTFIPNYDGSFKEPELLPAKLPFVLLNGASGIAVGMATEIPPHNIKEVAAAVLLLLKNPESTLDEILQVLPAPDFPGGAQIISSADEIRSIYETGRGSLKMRARYHFEDLQRGLWQLVVDELPPQASTEKVLSQIDEITNPKPAAGKKALSAKQLALKNAMLAVLDGARDECDKTTPVRIVFEPRTGKIDRDVFVNTLLTQTLLESNAPVNLVMLGIDGRPRQKGLKEILTEWISARRETVRRRTQSRLDKVNARLHILEGRTIAVDNLDRVIEIVRFDPDPKAKLMQEFSLSAEQSEDILDLRLRQLQNLEIEKVRKEMRELGAEKAELEKILGSESALSNVLAKETREAAKAYGDERRTLVQQAKKAVVEHVTESEPVTIVISQKGYVRCRGGHGHDATLMNYKMGDALLTSLECRSDDMLIALGSDGRAYSIAVSQLPSARGDGLPLTSFIDLQGKTTLVGYVAGDAKKRVLLATSAGFGMLCTVGDMTARVRAGKAFVNLTEGAQMLPPEVMHEGDKFIACLSGEGRLLAFESSEVRTLSGGGKGITLMQLNPGEKLLAALPADDSGVVVTGQGRTAAREKTLVKGDWLRHQGQRARKGKMIEVRFKALALQPIRKDEGGNAVVSENEEKPEPTIF